MNKKLRWQYFKNTVIHYFIMEFMNVLLKACYLIFFLCWKSNRTPLSLSLSLQLKKIIVFLEWHVTYSFKILAFHIMTRIFRCYIYQKVIYSRLTDLTFSGRNLELQNSSKAYRSLEIFHT